MKQYFHACAWSLLLASNAWAAVKNIEVALIGSPPSGSYEVVVEHDDSLATHTLYRPQRADPIKHPLLVWGNGACSKSGLLFAEFLTEIASHGIFVIADGPPIAGERHGRENRNAGTPPPRPSPGSLKPDGTALLSALDWVEARNSESGSRYFGKIDVTKVAAMGMSCGGLMAYGASGDERMDLAQLGGCRDCSKRRVLDLAAFVLDVDESLHCTTPSVFSLPISSSTEPTLSPACRLGGSATFSTSRRRAMSTPSSSGVFVASGFALAFMMLGSDA